MRAKYLAERDRRLVAGRADIRDLSHDEYFARYRDDPFTTVVDRPPVNDDVDVVIVGGGIAGVTAGAQLRKAGIEKIRIVDQAGGIGGTWYWNRYPGVMCDVESYIYLPLLEELGYVPSQRYALGEEIRLYLDSLARHFDLVDDALFHTGITRAEWHDDEDRWHIQTDRGDQISCRWYVMAVGILNLMKLPGYRRHGELRRSLLPYRALGLRLHRRWTIRAHDQYEGQGGGSRRHGRLRHSGVASIGRSGQAGLRLSAHALRHRGAG